MALYVCMHTALFNVGKTVRHSEFVVELNPLETIEHTRKITALTVGCIASCVIGFIKTIMRDKTSNCIDCSACIHVGSLQSIK